MAVRIHICSFFISAVQQVAVRETSGSSSGITESGRRTKTKILSMISPQLVTVTSSHFPQSPFLFVSILQRRSLGASELPTPPAPSRRQTPRLWFHNGGEETDGRRGGVNQTEDDGRRPFDMVPRGTGIKREAAIGEGEGGEGKALG